MNDSANGGTVLCPLDTLDVRDSKGFVLGEPGARRKLFVVRDENGVYGYENCCPHSRGPLEWVEDQFMSLDRSHIQCTQHGAMFQLNDGLCVYGPCVGESLTPVNIAVTDGNIVLLD